MQSVPFVNKPMQVTYAYNEIDQLTYEFGEEKLKDNGYGSPYEVYYDHDADGNMIEKTLYKGWSITGAPESGKVTTYAYDAEDRLTQILFPNNQTNTFYDCFCGAKQMEYTDASDEVTRYFLDGDQILYEYDDNNQIKSRYTNGPGIDEKISVTRYTPNSPKIDSTPNSQKTTSNPSSTRATYYYHYDGLGSVTAMTDEKGKLIETYDYDPYGVIIDHDRNVTKNLYTYTGRNYISDAGIYYYRNRYYDSRLGRFTTVDPLLHQPSRTTRTFQPFIRPSSCQTCGAGSQNTIQTLPTPSVNQNTSTLLEHPYVYVRNNPINYTDPTGEKVQLCRSSIVEFRSPVRFLGLDNIDVVRQTRDPDASWYEKWRIEIFHVWVQVVNNPCGNDGKWEFDWLRPPRSTTTINDVLMLKSVPGHERVWEDKPIVDCNDISARPVVDECVFRAAREAIKLPWPRYNLATHNCSHWAHGIVNSCTGR